MKQVPMRLIIDPADEACFRHVKRRLPGYISPWHSGGLNTSAAPLNEIYWVMYFAFSDPDF